MGPNQTKLLNDLTEVRNQLDNVLDDASVISLPRHMRNINNDFDAILQKLEDGEYEEVAEDDETKAESEEEEKEDK